MLNRNRILAGFIVPVAIVAIAYAAQNVKVPAGAHTATSNDVPPFVTPYTAADGPPATIEWPTASGQIFTRKAGGCYWRTFGGVDQKICFDTEPNTYTIYNGTEVVQTGTWN